MTYEKAKEIAITVRNFDDVNKFLVEIVADENITARQYHNLKYMALQSAWSYLT